MSKNNSIINPAFQKSAPTGVGFNLVNQTSNFNSVFDVQPLDQSEDYQLKMILNENFIGESEEESEKITQDFELMKKFTSEIKAIGRQGIVLVGERVFKAREVLKPYKDGTFTKWLDLTFGTRKTGYNMLAYFELYKALPHEEIKEQFKKIPQKTAYILASRNGNIDIKAEIIREYHNLNHDELVSIIQEKIPVATCDQRKGKDQNTRLITSIENTLKKIQRKTLTEKNIFQLRKLTQLIDSLVL